MRKSHIDYLRSMVESVVFDSVFVFNGKFLETLPPVDTFQSSIPCCVIDSVRVNHNLDGRQSLVNRTKNKIKLSTPVFDADGNKYVRHVREEFRQEFTYKLYFAIKDQELVSKDVVSDVGSPGVLDQCLIFISQNPKTFSSVLKSPDAVSFNELNYEIGVDALSSELITTYASEGLFILSLDVIFRDRLMTLVETPVLMGALDIQEPIKISPA